MRAFILALALAGCAHAVPTAQQARNEVPISQQENGETTFWNTGCAAVDGLYRLDAAPGFTAGFRAAPEGYQSVRDHLLWVRSETTGQTYWFGFVVHNGYGGVFMVPQSGPEVLTNPSDVAAEVFDAGLSIYPMGLDGVVGYEPPQGELSDAPPLLFIPELAPVLWYNAEAYGGDVRESMPRALFRLESCNGEAVAWSVDQTLTVARAED